jgi:Salmonella virulence plasmid 28.1kDa A protein
VWHKASQVNALALTLLTNFGHDFNKLMPKAIPYKPISALLPAISALPADLKGNPTLQELFGSLDFCDCEHCKSVYSPAACFVDLLQFLKNGTKTNGRSPLTVLLGRRPDLTEIELSCENTNTRMPYVDLVNEVLENAATRFALDFSQTRAKEEELCVQPEYINPGAYLRLAEAVHPWNLPFDLWWQEAQIYMTHLGFDRYAWMEKLPPIRAHVPHEVRVACDHLGLTTTEYELITGALNLPEPQLWGLKGSRIDALRDVKGLLWTRRSSSVSPTSSACAPS